MSGINQVFVLGGNVVTSFNGPQPAAQSGVWSVSLNPTNAVIGKVIIDSGTVAATQSGPWVVSLNGSAPLPSGAATCVAQQTQTELLTMIMQELRIHTLMLTQGMNIKDDPNAYRNDTTLMN